MAPHARLALKNGALLQLRQERVARPYSAPT
jgi:hypothetical protein